MWTASWPLLLLILTPNKLKGIPVLLAVDPGAGRTSTIGVALFNFETGSLVELHQFTFQEFCDFLDKIHQQRLLISHIVYEVYVIRRKYALAHVGSKVEVVESIGVLKRFAAKVHSTISYQESKILPIAEKRFQVFLPKKHEDSHQISALLHGMYWLNEQGIIPTTLEAEMKAKKK